MITQELANFLYRIVLPGSGRRAVLQLSLKEEPANVSSCYGKSSRAELGYTGAIFAIIFKLVKLRRLIFGNTGAVDDMPNAGD